MTAACDQVGAFADGELTADEAEAFRGHLAGCAACQRELHELMQLQAHEPARLREPVHRPATAPAPGPAPIVELAARRRRPGWIVAAVVVPVIAAAAAVWFLFLRPRDGGAPREPVLALAPARSIEARLSHPLAAAHRPYEVQRAGGQVGEAIPLRALAALEERGDLHGLADAHLLAGDPARAAAALAGAGSSPALDSDRAALALVQGDAAGALALAQRALDAAPDHPQALWNRALALRELGLPGEGAAAFARAAAHAGDAAWAAEASERAAALRTGIADRRTAAERVMSDGLAMVQGGPPLSAEAVQTRPGAARLYFYDAVRTAPSAARLDELQPLAALLDAHFGGTALAAAVARARTADWSRRAPLAARYAELAADPAGFVARPGAAEGLLDGARRAGQIDILLGALLHSGQIQPHLEEYRRLAAATADPWFAALAAHEHVRAALAAGDLLAAEQRLATALPACVAGAVEFRCLRLELELAYTELTLQRPVEARAHALAGLAMARRGNEWEQEVQALRTLGDIARYGHAFHLTEAYLLETLHRDDSCPSQRYVHLQLAMAHVNGLRFDRARASLSQAPRCDEPPLLLAAMVAADLARFDGTAAEADAVRADLAALRTSGTLLPGQDVMATYVEGRLVSVRDRAAGTALLRRAIAEADAAPPGTGEADRARAYAYGTLIVAAGAAEEWSDALALFGAELGAAEPPGPCTLGVTVDDERVLAVARRADGSVVGRYRADRRDVALDPAQLVPADVVAALDGCAEVAVIARPPLQGLAGLLPDTLAWSFRISARPQAPQAPRRRLVVSGVDAPPELGLGVLRAPAVTARPGETLDVLSGAAATPARVAAAFDAADRIELHVHGLVNPELSDAAALVLSPDAAGHFALTAGDIRRRSLRARPLVLLAACHAAQSAPYLHPSWSLPTAFLDAGASAVIASPAAMPDADAATFFAAVSDRIAAGASPAAAVRDERLARDRASWARAVIVFH